MVAVSTFALIFYYAIANISSFRLGTQSRVYPRFVPAAGLASCLLLLPFISAEALMMAALCLAVGIGYYAAKKNRKDT